MYQTHWGLRESPFRGPLDPKSFYQSPTHEEALARLHFLVEQRRRLGLLVGPSGSGKSLLLEVFAEQLRRTARPVGQAESAGRRSGRDARAAGGRVGIEPRAVGFRGRLWRAVTDRLIEYRYQQLEAVVLLDDADQADPQVLATRQLVWPASIPRPSAADHRVGRPQRGDVEPGPVAPGSGRSADRRRALGAERDARVRQHLVGPGRAARRRSLPSRPWPGCTSFPAAFPAASPNWPTLHSWPAPGHNVEQIDAGVVEAVYQELAT